MKTNDTISLDEVYRLDAERRKRELPWTAADEARLDAKRKAEREANEAFAAAHPQPDEEDDEEDEDEE